MLLVAIRCLSPHARGSASVSVANFKLFSILIF